MRTALSPLMIPGNSAIIACFPGDDKQDCKNGAKKAGNREMIETAAEV